MIKKWWQRLKQVRDERFEASETEQNFPIVSFDEDAKSSSSKEARSIAGLLPKTDYSFTIVKRLIRSVSYTALHPLVGQKIVLSSFANATEEIRSFLKASGFELGATMQEPNELALLKYGIVDCSFVSLGCDSSKSRQNARFLGEMGLLLPSDELSQDTDLGDGISYLKDLLAEVEMNKVICKIMLDSCKHHRLAAANATGDWRALETGLFFPSEYVVRDACITNCSSIWMWKHFYL